MSNYDKDVERVVFIYDLNTLQEKIQKFTEVNFSKLNDQDIPIFEHRCSTIAIYILTLAIKSKTNLKVNLKDYLLTESGRLNYADSLNFAVTHLDKDLTREKLAEFQRNHRVR
jgi:hypothetical protein